MLCLPALPYLEGPDPALGGVVRAEPLVAGEGQDVAGQDVKVGFPDPRYLKKRIKDCFKN